MLLRASAFTIVAVLYSLALTLAVGAQEPGAPDQKPSLQQHGSTMRSMGEMMKDCRARHEALSRTVEGTLLMITEARQRENTRQDGSRSGPLRSVSLEDPTRHGHVQHCHDRHAEHGYAHAGDDARWGLRCSTWNSISNRRRIMPNDNDRKKKTRFRQRQDHERDHQTVILV